MIKDIRHIKAMLLAALIVVGVGVQCQQDQAGGYFWCAGADFKPAPKLSEMIPDSPVRVSMERQLAVFFIIPADKKYAGVTRETVRKGSGRKFVFQILPKHRYYKGARLVFIRVGPKRHS